jgi:hypothetical protein
VQEEFKAKRAALGMSCNNDTLLSLVGDPDENPVSFLHKNSYF